MRPAAASEQFKFLQKTNSKTKHKDQTTSFQNTKEDSFTRFGVAICEKKNHANN